MNKSTNSRIELKNLKIDDEIILDISPYFLRENFNLNLYLNYDAFIKHNNTAIKDQCFYILDKNISSEDEENKYLEIHRLIINLQSMLKSISNYTNEKNFYIEYIIFDSKKITISSEFTDTDIELIENNEKNFGITIANLFEEIGVKNEKKIREVFFKKSLEIVFGNNNITVSEVLKNIEKIFSEYEAHYRAYINTLEPEKIKYQFEEEHNAFLKDLNTILGDVHNKIIFIPIAFIFGSTQLTANNCLKGIVIILGMLVFSIFVSLFLETHQKVLNVISEKLSEKEAYYKVKEPTLYKKYEVKIKILKDLLRSIEIRICVVKYVNWTLSFGTACIFAYLNNIILSYG